MFLEIRGSFYLPTAMSQENTNFAYLSSDWPQLFRLARETEQSLSARSVLFKCRLLVEVGLEWLYENEHQLNMPAYRMSLDDMINDKQLKQVMPKWQVREMDLVRREGNLAAHEPKVIRWDRAHVTLKHTHRFLAWLDANYGEEPDEDRKLREGWLPPQTIADATEREAILEEKLAQVESENRQLKREIHRLEGRLDDKTTQLAAMKMKKDLAAARKKKNTELGRNDET
ncbi:MAG TPA: hypothetical protein DCR93_13275, partial [Cytophagales bacterium]|nr:hypothetical protein [Cytophagales bacterium]